LYTDRVLTGERVTILIQSNNTNDVSRGSSNKKISLDSQEVKVLDGMRLRKIDNGWLGMYMVYIANMDNGALCRRKI